jgi:hypothetical protein
MNPLFSGTIYFVQVTFATPGGNFAFSTADMQTMLNYAQHAVVPISEWVQQYGTSSAAISPTLLQYTANMSSTSFADSDLQGWVHDIVNANGLSANSVVIVPCPQQISESGGGIGGNSGYHGFAGGANVSYVVFGVNATGLTLADEPDVYAMVVSHEIAEVIVDPQGNFSNPEVCDPCCENCISNFYRAYFDSFNDYLGTNQSTPPGGFDFAYYAAVVVQPAGAATSEGDCHATNAECDYPPTPQNFYFVVDKNDFGLDEVKDNLSYPSSFWLFLEGYSPAAVGGSVPSFAGSFNSADIPGLQINLTSTTYDIGNTGANANLPQRIRFGYDIVFAPASISAFPGPGAGPDPFSLSATIKVQGEALPFNPLTEFFLLSGGDPYFTNVRAGTGNYFYMSQDLRVFSATAGSGSVPVSGGPEFSTDSVAGAYDYVQKLITYLNQKIGYSNLTYTPTDSPDPLDSLLPNQGGALAGDSSVTPKNGSANNYNFAVARVRLKGASGPMAAADNVKVFFRVFDTQTCDTDFINTGGLVSAADPNITYPSGGGLNDPTNPLPGTAGNGTINGSTLPFFATANYDNSPSDYTSGGANNQNIAIPGGHDYAWAFFGCFLNVYDDGNKIGGQTPQFWLGSGSHHCLVAQIAYSDAPILNEPGVIENPENSDKLAQRNLQVTGSGNPGFPVTHRVPQTLDVRPSPAVTQDTSSLAGYPDELMIDWGTIPRGSVASIYWPAVTAASVLQLAGQFYPGHMLSAADANTIQCKVISPVTYVPIPSGTSDSFAGLFTVDLPDGIRVGNKFDITVRRITTKRQVVPPPQPVPQIPRKGGRRATTVAVAKELVWRYIVGTFAVQIPVEKENKLLPGDENLLAILKWRLGLLGVGNRWYPVLLRWISYLSARVNAMGGNASSIPASANGYQPPAGPGTHGEPSEHCYTGKVTGIFYDGFGDFQGFELRSEHCKERRFHAHELEIQELIYLAWVQRFVITVCVCPHEEHRVESVVLRRAPRSLRC